MRSKWFAPIVIALVLLFGAAVYPRLPDQVPTHWGLSGEVNGYQPKALAIVFMPVLMALVWGLGRTGYQFRWFGRRLDSAPTTALILNLLVGFLGIMQVIALGSALGWQISTPNALMTLLGLMMAALGNQMRRLKPNLFIGIRTPWTLRDPETWRRTHAYAGRVYFGVGLLIAASGLLLPFTVSLALGIVLLLVVSAWVIYYSYRISRRISRSITREVNS